MRFDVVIVGGGVIGLATARELRKCGVEKIAVVDRGPAGREASWAAAGMLAPDLECEEIDDFHRFCTMSRELYPGFAEQLVSETGIDIELDRSGTLYLAFGPDEAVAALDRLERQTAAGIPVEKLSVDEVLEREPLASPKVDLGLYYPNDWQVENRKVVQALISYSRNAGVELIEGVAVERVIARRGRAVGIGTAAGPIEAPVVVLASGAWTSQIDTEGLGVSIPVRPIKGQMISFAGGAGRFRHVIFSHRGYVVPRADGRVLVGATVEDAGFQKEVSEAGSRSLAAAAVEISPIFEGASPQEQWAGLRPYSADGRPVIGPVPGIEGLFVATGHYRNGILLCPLTAKIVAESIVKGRESEYFSFFGPNRLRGKQNARGQTNI